MRNPLKSIGKKAHEYFKAIVKRLQRALFLLAAALAKWLFSFDRVKDILIDRIDSANKKQLNKALAEYGKSRNENT